MILNISYAKIKAILLNERSECPIEYWPIKDGLLHGAKIKYHYSAQPTPPPPRLPDPSRYEEELRVYGEQITASIYSLWQSHALYFPDELPTIRSHARLAQELFRRWSELRNEENPSRRKNGGGIERQKARNAVSSALVELGGALSYVAAQGSSGGLPILTGKSPFPHHSLLGVGTAIRAITVFTRYIEQAMVIRSASRVIEEHYHSTEKPLPVDGESYAPGPEYKFESLDYCFDSGGDFAEVEPTPLLVYLSLRHGFKETKMAVTAASEILTAETLSHWTLMTLSHEVMHSRVRGIFNALFGQQPEETAHATLSESDISDFARFLKASRAMRAKQTLRASLRNAVLHFCCSMESACKKTPEKMKLDGKEISAVFLRHRRLAIELFVHFHDFFFIYRRQEKLYAMAIWASWIRIAAPTARLQEYVLRTLATIASCSALKPGEAFKHAIFVLRGAIRELRDLGLRSVLFDEIMKLLNDDQDGDLQTYFDTYYVLISQAWLCFRSRRVSEKIDSLDRDPFSEGSAATDNYSATIYVQGDADNNAIVSPLRFILNGFLQSIEGTREIDDVQWQSAWELSIIASQRI